LRLGALGSGSVEGTVALKNGLLTLNPATIRVEDLQATGTARLNLHEPYAFSAQLGLDRADLAALRDLPSGLTGRLSVNGDVMGPLQPLTVHGAGNLMGHGVKLKNLSVDDVSATWRLDDTALSLEQIRATIDRGRLIGSAQLPLRADQPGCVE